MTELPANLVIRRVAPRRTLVLTTVAVVGGLLALGASFEAGRYQGGYDVIAAARQRAQLQATAARLEKDNSALRKQVTDLDTTRVGLAQERTELAHTIGELQSQVASQAQQLAFYRGVVSHGVSQDDLAMGLKIQQLTITANSVSGEGSSSGGNSSSGAGSVSGAGGVTGGDSSAGAVRASPSVNASAAGTGAGAGSAGAATETGVAGGVASTSAAGAAHGADGRFDVHLTLLQTANPQAAMSGTFQLSIEGRSQGKTETLDLAALTDGKLSTQPFSFRYYQSLEQHIALPAGFSPERLTVEVRAGGKPVTPLIQTFPWKVESP